MARKKYAGIREVTITSIDKSNGRKEQFKGDIDLKCVRNVTSVIKDTWSYEYLNEGLDKNLGFTDSDGGNFESHGHVLQLEFKQSIRNLIASPYDGQLLLAVHQALLNNTSTWFIEGRTNQPKLMVRVEPSGLDIEISELEEINWEDFYKHRDEWFSNTKKNPITSKRWDLVADVQQKILEGLVYNK